MNIALIAHDGKKELMARFCEAYARVLGKHDLCVTGTTGAFLIGQTDLPIKLFMNDAQSGAEQIGSGIALGEIDLLLFFCDPDKDSCARDVAYLADCCARSNVPYAINSATAEALALALSRGDLDWREAIRLNSMLTEQTKELLGSHA